MRALILSAGYGTRLGELTQKTPKPLLEVSGRPLLELIISNLSNQGIKDIGINLHFMPELITTFFGDGSNWDVRLTYFFEPELLGTAGSVKINQEFLEKDGDFLVHYGDVITDQDFRAMQQFHRSKKATATLLLHRRERSNSMVNMDESNRIVRFLERPDKKDRLSSEASWVNSGVCICAPKIFELIPTAAPSDLARDVFAKATKNQRMFGFPLTGFRFAIDSLERLAEANNYFATTNS